VADGKQHRSDLAPSYVAWLRAQDQRREELARTLRTAWQYQLYPRRSIHPYVLHLSLGLSARHGALSVGPQPESVDEPVLDAPWCFELFLRQALQDPGVEAATQRLDELLAREGPPLKVVAAALDLPEAAASWLIAGERREALLHATLAFVASDDGATSAWMNFTTFADIEWRRPYPPRTAADWTAYLAAEEVPLEGEPRFRVEHYRLRHARAFLQKQSVAVPLRSDTLPTLSALVRLITQEFGPFRYELLFTFVPRSRGTGAWQVVGGGPLRVLESEQDWNLFLEQSNSLEQATVISDLQRQYAGLLAHLQERAALSESTAKGTMGETGEEPQGSNANNGERNTRRRFRAGKTQRRTGPQHSINEGLRLRELIARAVREFRVHANDPEADPSPLDVVESINAQGEKGHNYSVRTLMHRLNHWREVWDPALGWPAGFIPQWSRVIGPDKTPIEVAN
jgi:hypothetical protein